jgi:hypothetical protein
VDRAVRIAVHDDRGVADIGGATGFGISASSPTKSALTADPAWQHGWFASPPTRGFQAMGRVYAGWGLSQAFYREEIWCKIGFPSLEDFARRLRNRANLRSTSRSAVGGYAVSVKAEPIEENKNLLLFSLQPAAGSA